MPSDSNFHDYLFHNGHLISKSQDQGLYHFNIRFNPVSNLWPFGSLIYNRAAHSARICNRVGPDFYFLVTSNCLDEEIEQAFWLPEESKKETPKNPDAPLMGLSSFLSPETGWLITLTESLGLGAKKNWPEHSWPPLLDLPPLGISFLWTSPEQLESDLLSLIKKLPENEKILIVTNQSKILEVLVQNNEGQNLLYLSQGAQGPLLPVSLSQRLEERLTFLLKKQDNAREELASWRVLLEKTEKELASWRNLEILENDLILLQTLTQTREEDWKDREKQLKKISDDWSLAETALNRNKRGFLGIFPHRKNSSTEIQQKEMREHLEKAEANMRQVRQERAGLLKEARLLTDRLAQARDETSRLASRESLNAKIFDQRTKEEGLKTIVASLSRIPTPSEETMALIDEHRILLTRPEWTLDSLLNEMPDNLILIGPPVRNHEERLALTHEAVKAKKRFIVLSDFSTWGSFEAKEEPGQNPGWHTFMTATTNNFSPKSWAGHILGPLPLLKGEKNHLTPDPADWPWLSQLMDGPLGRHHILSPQGFAIRNVGEQGPVNPVSALAAVKLAANASNLSGKNDPIYILGPSAAQGALTRAMLQDLAPENNIYAGEPFDFELWPKAALVILDTAFETPHKSSPWSLQKGRLALLKAFDLAGGALILSGSNSLEKLPSSSPLGRMVEQKWPAVYSPEKTKTNAVPAFWEALDQAKTEAHIIMPPFEPQWWEPLAPHFIAALNRKVKISFLIEIPEEQDRDYPGTVIRDLRLFGASVILTRGFSGFMAVIDQKHFSFGLFSQNSGKADWSALRSQDLPIAAPLLNKIFQWDLISEKLGFGNSRTCPLCGWPFVLINQDQARDFGDPQPFLLGCLNPNCQNRRRPRRLDERWPFSRPPICQQDQVSVYIRNFSGRTEKWVCPKHPETCPDYKVIPGDPKEGRGR